MTQTMPLNEIEVTDRYRKDLGDIDGLAESIKNRGLLHPVVVTANGRLISGQRRVEACRELGWEQVPVTVIADMGSASELLAAERDENTRRKDMTASELYALGKALEELERPKAEARQKAHLREGDEAPSGSGELDGNPKRTADIVGPAIGSSSTTWNRLKHVGDKAADGHEEAIETLERMDRGEESIRGGFEHVRDYDENGGSGDEAAADDPEALANVGDVRTIPKRRTAAFQIRRLNEQVASLATAVEMIEGLDELDAEEATELADGLSDGLSPLNSLRNRLRKAGS